MPMIAVNGTRLFHELAGDSGEPVVLVHGSWGDHHNWDSVVPMLSRSFRVLTYDRRGHSRSERPTTQGSLREDAADLAALLEALGMAPAHVVGNSGGAAVALRLACERPGLFRSLVVHEPPLFALLAGDPAMQAPLGLVQQRVAAVEDLLRAGDGEGAARTFVDTIAFGPGGWDRLPEAEQTTFIANAPTFLDERQDPEGMIVDLNALARFARPALLSRGDRSPPFFPAVVERLARALPHGVLYEFTGEGHVPHRSAPERYVDVVGGFIARASAAAGPVLPSSDERPAPAS